MAAVASTWNGQNLTQLLLSTLTLTCLPFLSSFPLTWWKGRLALGKLCQEATICLWAVSEERSRHHHWSYCWYGTCTEPVLKNSSMATWSQHYLDFWGIGKKQVFPACSEIKWNGNNGKAQEQIFATCGLYCWLYFNLASKLKHPKLGKMVFFFNIEKCSD